MDSRPTEADPAAWLPWLLQTADALFPTGSYAHSLGFEECVRLGIVHDENSLRQFLQEQIAPALEHFDLPYLRLAHEAASFHDFGALADLDAEVGATKIGRETRAASSQLGQRRLRSLQNIHPDEPRLSACALAITGGSMTGHHVIICAVQAVVAGAPLDAALAAFYYQSLAAVAGAALKLIRVGQDGVQRALHAAVGGAAGAVARSRRINREDAGWFNPLLEIGSSRHERAGERLFIS